MRLLIVEDEPLIARRLEHFCRTILAEEAELIHWARTFDEAAAELSQWPFDLVLLDLKLEERNGMELLATSVAGSFHTIIVSADLEQALRAFEFGVIDFVPKPFTLERIAQALRRAGTGRSSRPARHLAVRQHGRIELIEIDEVLYVQASDKYSELVLENGRRALHDKTLSRLEAVLPPAFERTHKSYLVRMSAVKQLFCLEGTRYELELRNGVRLPVGRTRYPALKAKLIA